MAERGRAVYGNGPVRELLDQRAREVEALCVADADSPVAELARARGVSVRLVSKEELQRLAGGGARHQGVVALTGEFPYAAVEDLIDAASSSGRAPLLVALDGVQDPHNLGAIVRSAHALGAHGLIVPRDRAARVTPVVSKASAGATEHLPIAQATNLVRALEELKQADLWIVGLTTGPRSRPLWELDATVGLCLVLGSEGKGLRPLVSRTCDLYAEVPMPPGVGSLNVSVAAGVALYEIARQRAG